MFKKISLNKPKKEKSNVVCCPNCGSKKLKLYSPKDYVGEFFIPQRSLLICKSCKKKVDVASIWH